MNSAIPIHSPPRKVPWSTKFVVLFGGMFSLFGWFYFGFGMCFIWAFVAKGDYTSAFVMRGPLETAPGMITQIDSTRYTQGGNRYGGGRRIFAYHYKFNTGGTTYQGTSYSSGQPKLEHDTVTVEFPTHRPGYSRIKGMRRAMFGPYVAFVLIFPAVGLAIVLPGLWHGWRSIHLLANGETAPGTLIRKEPTKTSVSKKPVYKFTFEFTDAFGQKRQVTAKTHRPKKLEDDSTKLVFYSRNDSAKATLLDNLPGDPSFNDKGELKPCGFGQVLAAVLPPVIGVAVVLGGLLVKLRG